MAEADPFPPQNTPAAVSPAAQAASEHAGATRSKRMRMVLMILGPVAAVAGGLWYWFGNPGVVETDNAYIKQDIVAVAGEVSGLITQVKVRDNQHVKAGDVCSRSILRPSTQPSSRPTPRSRPRRPE